MTHVLTSQSPCLAPSLQLFMSLKSLPQSCSLLTTTTPCHTHTLSVWPQLLANLWHCICSGTSQGCSFSQSPALFQAQNWLDKPLPGSPTESKHCCRWSVMQAFLINSGKSSVVFQKPYLDSFHDCLYVYFVSYYKPWEYTTRRYLLRKWHFCTVYYSWQCRC